MHISLFVMKQSTFFSLCIGLLLSINVAKAQLISDVGIAGLYNFQANGIGADVRLFMPIVSTLYFIPRFSYYPSSNKTTEMYAGFDLSKYITDFYGFNPYIFVGGYYNNWINNKDFYTVAATKHNFTIEPGIGILFYRGCWNPFIETRYSTKWKEFTGAVGIILHFGDCFRSKCGPGGVNGCPSFH